MHRLLENFLEENYYNRVVFYKGVIKKNEKCLEEFKMKFRDYLLRVFLCSYIKKSIYYTAKKIRKRRLWLVNNEKLSLNEIETDFDEERITLIVDDPTDISKLFYASYDHMNYREILCDRNLILAVDRLTARQKEVIWKHIIQDKQETEVARELGVSVQAVNKVKNAALRKLRKQLEVV